MSLQVVPNDNTFNAPANNPSTGLEAGRVLKASPGVLYGLSGLNTGAAAFVQLFDSATVPADSAVPVEVIAVGAGASFNIDFGMHGKSFGIGMSACISSTAAIKTIAGAVGFFAPRFK